MFALKNSSINRICLPLTGRSAADSFSLNVFTFLFHLASTPFGGLSPSPGAGGGDHLRALRSQYSRTKIVNWLNWICRSWSQRCSNDSYWGNEGPNPTEEVNYSPSIARPGTLRPTIKHEGRANLPETVG